MFGYFEKLVDPYPEGAAPAPPRGFFAFVWACTEGMRPFIAGDDAAAPPRSACSRPCCSRCSGASSTGSRQVEPARLWDTERGSLLLLGAILLASPLAIALQTLLKHQTLAGNFPMRLRWNFHRLMLGQSMSFYQDEFAGRVATKVMQTALAVRDTVMIVADILVFVVIYFVTMVAVVGSFDAVAAAAVPRLAGAVRWRRWRTSCRAWRAWRKAQADARSLMTGRITDAYTNIATVKLFSHANREAGFARSAMQEFMLTVHGQMRLVSGFEIVNHTLSMLLIVATAGATLWLWTQGQVGVGAVAAATAMALRLNGISHWIMWEMAALFEHIGTVQDGINTLSRPHAVVDRPEARAAEGDARRDPLRAGELRLRRRARQRAPVIDDLSLHIRPGEKIGLVGRSGAGKSTIVNLLLRFYDVEQRPRPDRRAGHRACRRRTACARRSAW